MGLDRLAWRAVAARPLRSLLTILGIMLGVAVLTASLTLGAALEQAVERTVGDMVGRADLRVSGFLESGLSDESVETIRTTDGVVDSTAVVEARTFPSGKPAGGAADAVTVLGVDPASYARIHDLQLAAGMALEAPDEPVALMTQALAAQDGYSVGSRVLLLGPNGLTSFRVVGLLPGIGPLGGSGRTVVLPIEAAQAALGIDGVTRVDLVLDPNAKLTIRGALAFRMHEPYVLSAPADLATNLRASAAAFQGTAALVAAVVLFVGAFLIVNTLTMTVGERAREVGLLRAAGATRAQLSRFVFTGALYLGVFGSVMGVMLGTVMADFMSGAVGQATGLSASVKVIDASGAITAALLGILITVMAAIQPALAAARISPVEALRARFDLPAVRRARTAWIAVTFIVVAALSMLAWPPVSGTTGAGQAMAVYLVLLCATLLSPFVLQPMARLLGAPVALVLRLEERLARGSLARDRNRTTLTLGSLVIGLAMIVALGWSAQAARSSAFAWLEDVMPGDEIVTSIRPVGPDEPALPTLAAVPGVAAVTPIASFDVAYRGERLDAAAISGADFLADGRLTFVSGNREGALGALDAGGAAILPKALAESLGLTVGDLLQLPLGGTRSIDLTVVGIVERSMPGSSGEAILVGWHDATTSLGVLGADAFAVRFIPGAADRARPGLRDAARSLALEANPIERVQGAVAEALARVFGLFDALALVAVLVAALGIINTLTMGVLERVREIGVLRAIGMSRGQALRMVVVEASILGIVGAVLGALAGLGAGAVLLQLGGGLGHPGGLPWLPIGIAAALGLILPAVAAIYPARAAANVSIVEALYFD
jgi:putative ABC transport system permease protein